MFSKKHRITKRLFEEVFSSGKTIKTKHFLLKYRKNEESTSRISVVASKKIFKTAVLRNKVKRKFKAVLKETQLVKSNNDLIFILNKSAEVTKKEDMALIINQIRLK